MGHYDDQYEADRQRIIKQRKREVVQMAHDLRFECLIDAAHLCSSPTVTVKLDTFELMLEILKDLDPKSYSTRW